MNRYKKTSSPIIGPLLDAARLNSSVTIDNTHYPFCVPIIKNLQELSFPSQVTFFIGENGTGKSTLLEAIAYHAGFGAEGGSKNIAFKTSGNEVYSGTQNLSDHLTLSWRQKPKDGYFFRAESFYNVANYIDYLQKECGGAAYDAYGGKSLHAQSHGESFLSFFKNRVGKGGFFILDEPEAALSPQRQLALLIIINELTKHSNTQFIIATHSPILLAYPQSTIYSCDDTTLKTIEYTDTPHYQITKDFLNNPAYYLETLFKEDHEI
ncbi:MAG: AAA family ATPase [Candidatus Babeliales bacterium]